MPRKILIVSNDTAEVNKIKRQLENLYAVTTALETENIIEILVNENIDLILGNAKIITSSDRELFLELKEHFPKVIRIALGDNEKDAFIFNSIQKNLIRACILRPWDKNILSFINKFFQTDEHLQDSKFYSRFADINDLPTINQSYQMILHLIDNDSDMENISEAISNDPSMAAKLLRIVNSAFYGVKTTSIKQAVTYLGMNNIRNMVMSTSIFDMFNSNDVPERMFLPLWQQAFSCSKIVNATYKILKKNPPPYASLAGLLINIGIIFLLHKFDTRYMNLIQEVKQLNSGERNVSLENLEIELYGATHAEVGGYLLNYWEIPYPIVEAAIFHFNPLNESVIDKELLCIVHLAEYYSLKEVFMDSSINFVDECLEYLSINRNLFEAKLAMFL